MKLHQFLPVFPFRPSSYTTLFLFVTGATGNLYELYSNDGGMTWNTANPGGLALGWLNLGGVLKSSPSAAVSSPPLSFFGPTYTYVVIARGGGEHLAGLDGRNIAHADPRYRQVMAALASPGPNRVTLWVVHLVVHGLGV